MAGKKDMAREGGAGLQSLKSLDASLPSKTRRGAPLRLGRGPTATPLSTPALPDCFAEVARRTGSKLPAHVRERATLEAVASTIPAAARKTTGASAAGVYLAALVLALGEVVTSAKPAAAAADDSNDTEAKPGTKKLSRRQRRMQRRRDEQDVQHMSAMDARAVDTPSTDVEMSKSKLSEAGEDAKGEEAADTEFISSLIYLVGLAARGSNRALVNAKARDILSPIVSALSLPSPTPLLGRHAAAAIASVLLALAPSAWAAPEIAQAYLCLLSIAASSLPKNRRRGREALVAVLRGVALQPVSAACSRAAAAWFVRECSVHAERCEESRTGAKEEYLKNYSRLVHHVSSVNYFAFVLGEVECAQIAKELCLLMQRDVKSIVPFAYNSLTFLFCIPKRKVDVAALIPPESADLSVEHLGTGLAASRKFLLGEARVPQKDAEKLLAAVSALPLLPSCNSDARVARARALATMAVAVHTFYPHSPPPKAATSTVVDALVSDLDPIALSISEMRQQAVFTHELLKQKRVMQSSEVFDIIKQFSTIKYKRHWGTVLPLLKEYISSGVAVSLPRMQQTLAEFVNALVQMRKEAIATAHSSSVSLVDGLLAAALRGGGAPHLLKAAPIQRDEKELLTNAWMLPILADNIRNAPLSLWSSTLSPLQLELEAASRAAAEKNDRAVEGKNMGMYSRQLLSLLPGLCTNPTDLAQAKIMNVAFQAIHYCFVMKDHVVQNYGANALRALSESILSTCTDGDDFHSGIRASFSSRLKKLFGSIVDVAEKLLPERRAALLQALTVAGRATGDAGLVVGLLRKTIRRFLEVAVKAVPADGDAMEDVEVARGTAVRVRHAASDIAIAIVESGVVPQDAQELSLLKRALLPFLHDRNDSVLQKKAYRAIVSLVSAGAFSSSAENTKLLVEEVAKSSVDVAPGAHSSRLSTVEAIMSMCQTAFAEDEKVELIKLCTLTFLSEAVLALRDTSEKTRQAAANSIITIGKTWTGNPSPQLGINNYFVALAAGLGGQSTAMMSGSLIAIGYFMKTFKNEIRTLDTLGKLCSSFFAQSCAGDNDEMTDKDPSKEEKLTHVRPGPITILLRHEALEVQRAALGVIKVAITVLGSPISRLLEILPGFLPSLVATAAESKKREIRLRVKVVIERLLRKCGREVLEARFPEEHKKLLSSVRKQHEKEKSKKLERRALSAMKADERDENADREGGNAEAEVGKDDEEFDFDIDSDDSDVEQELLDGNELLSQKQRQKANRTMAAQMEEPHGEVFDLLASDSINIAHANKLSAYAKSKGEAKENVKGRSRSSKKDDDDDDKPLVFMESASESEEAAHGSEEEEDEDFRKLKIRAKENSVLGRKRRRKETDDGPMKRSRGTFGEEYRSRRAAGDVKRAGRPDPYAYIPLGSSVSGGGSAKGGKLLSSSAGKGAKAKRQRKLGLPGKR